MYIVLKQSRLNGQRGDGGALTLHVQKIDAVDEAYNRSMKCSGEVYFIGEVSVVGEVRNAQPSDSSPEETVDEVIRRTYPAYEAY